jgi:hypothetical protein
MAKLVLNNVVPSDGEVNKAATINNNSDAIEAALEKTLSRDGTVPNEMESELDMNSNRIINLPEAISDTEPVRNVEFQTFVDSIDTIVDGISSAQVAAETAASQAAASAALLISYNSWFPGPITGQALKYIRVKADESGYEYAVASGGVVDGDYGDITVSGTNTVWTIDTDAITSTKIVDNAVTNTKIANNAVGSSKIADGNVTLAKMANMATSSLIYRKTAGTGVPEVNTLATLKTDLGLTGTNSGDQTITLTGDVTGSGTGSFAATIANDAVTYAKIQNVSTTDRVLGRSTAGSGDVEEIVCTAAGRALLDDVDASAQRTTLGLGTLATQSGTFSGTSSGTNTGDNAVNSLYSGLVSNATHTGDATGSTALTLATVNSNVGSFGLAASVAQFTVNAKGLITAAANVAISIASTAISDATAAGRSMLTAANAAAQTALLSVFVGDSGSGGTKGLVPAPIAGDAAKYLRGDGVFASITGGGDLLASNNLSELTTPSTARSNLGFGTTGAGNIFGAAINVGLDASVSGNALTISLKGANGSDPSSTNPVLIPFRNATLTTGTPEWLSVTAATSIVISSGSTLGTANNVAFKFWVVGFNDGGTFRLGVINPSATTVLGADVIASSTAEGGAGAADAIDTFYTGTAVTSKAYCILGYVEYSSGLATAGTYASAPTKEQVIGTNILLPTKMPTIQKFDTSGTWTRPSGLPSCQGHRHRRRWCWWRGVKWIWQQHIMWRWWWGWRRLH